MAFDLSLRTRVEFEGAPIYVRPDKPDWFVPNAVGDRLLRHLAGGGLAVTVLVTVLVTRIARKTLKESVELQTPPQEGEPSHAG